MPPRIDLLGQRFGMWVVGKPGVANKQKATRWVCKCDCGTARLVKTQALLSGASKSCGCWASERTAERSHRHGEASRDQRSPEWGTWISMRSRCLKKTDRLYPYYGGRGIWIHDDWITSFTSFLAYVGRKPGPSYSLDRVDNEGPYAPGNVRWATKTEQARNRRSNRTIEWRGERRVLAEWADILNLPYKVLHSRLGKQCWGVDRAFSTSYKERS